MEFDQIAQALLALVFVLALLGLAVALMRKVGFGYPTTIRNAKDKRLGVLEILPLDARRRLVLIRRDDAEHLILLGTDKETIIESPVKGKPSDFAALLEQAEATPDNEQGTS